MSENTMVKVVCRHCKKVSFRPKNSDGTRPIYCSPKHKKRAKNARNIRNRFGSLLDETKCEAPGASVYRDTPKNRKYLNRKAADYNRDFFICPCGGLHWKGLAQTEREED